MTLQPLKAAKPLQATKLTPNLIVSSVERSLAFYTEVLGFARGITVPEESPLAFAAVTSGAVEIFLNDKSTVSKESPQFARLSIGGGAAGAIVDGALPNNAATADSNVGPYASRSCIASTTRRSSGIGLRSA